MDATLLLDPATAEARLDDALARAEVAGRWQAVAAAQKAEAIARTLDLARAHPELYLPARPAAARPAAARPAAARPDPARRRDDDLDLAERAAVADLAVRLRMSEGAVRDRDRQATLLRRGAPRVWAAFCDGEVPEANAARVAEVLAELPRERHGAAEEALLEPAATLAPARFRERARRVRERLDPVTPVDRHRQARADRRVWLEADRDGMCWFGAYLDAVDGQRAMARLESAALSLFSAPDERRTLAQLRADVAAALLTADAAWPRDDEGGTDAPSSVPSSMPASVPSPARSGAGVRIPSASVSVAVTVPVLTLLGASDEPGLLAGHGPIDAETARALAAEAPGFLRILTHPVTGAVLDIDRTRYRPPAELRRWTALRDEHCTFPGCGRAAGRCDLDHITAWADGGATGVDNLAHLCRGHHRLKHETGWTVERVRDGTTVWTSPTEAEHRVPPPTWGGAPPF